MYQNDNILRAARRLARAGGAISMSEVAAKAGVSRATLYRAFPSRRALLEALRSQGVPVEERPDVETRAIDAMRRILLRGGFEGLTMESVASEGRLSLATVYRRFGDRAGLLRAFMRKDEARASLVEALDRRVESREELERVLTAFTEASLAALEEQRPLFLLVLSAPEEIRRAIRGFRDARRGTIAALAAFLAEQMKAGLMPRNDERALAAVYMGQLLSTAILLPEAGEALPPRWQLASLLARLFLHGALRREEAGIGREEERSR